MIENSVLSRQDQSARNIASARFGADFARLSIADDFGKRKSLSDIKKYDPKSLAISMEALELLTNHEFPGNYRQLRSVIKNAWVKSKQKIEVEHLSEELLSTGEKTVQEASAVWQYLTEKEFKKRMTNLEKDRIRWHLKNADNNVSKAAREMGIPRSQLDGKIKKLGLKAIKER